ncbi:hypothetical protein AB833_28840 [Chromatiales bacterium (ex Bugula neritina AB1)]|nr:hypothetical protein AB833_28840 [Chromatiales bacterium (ex Bugula neritina AB1)]
MAAALVLITTGVLADSRETRVTFSSEGQEVVGTLSVINGEPAPVALLLHGFTGSRDELKSDAVKQGVFAYTAEKLAEAGFSSLRIDFRGSGESIADKAFAETTFESQVADGIAAIDYLKSLRSVDGEDLHIIGWSQGGLVATAVAGRTGAPDAVALWAAVANPKSTFGNLFGTEAMVSGIAATADQTVDVKLPWGAEITLNGAFFDGLELFDPLAEIKEFDGPLFVAQGVNDTVVSPESADALIATHVGPEQLWTAEMDHVFNVFATGDTLEAMVSATILFFENHAD